MKEYWRVGWRYPPLFHNLGTRLECSFSHPGHFTLRNRASNTHRIRGWVDTRFSLDILQNRKISWPCQESKTDRPSCSLVIIITILSQLEFPQLWDNNIRHRGLTIWHTKTFSGETSPLCSIKDNIWIYKNIQSNRTLCLATIIKLLFSEQNREVSPKNYKYQSRIHL